MESVDVVVVGGGQAGLATSHELTQAGVEHVVLERARVGQTWRERWDTFCLVTPNRSVRLPGHPYAGNDPDGYMPRDEIVEFPAGVCPIRSGVGSRGGRSHVAREAGRTRVHPPHLFREHGGPLRRPCHRGELSAGPGGKAHRPPTGHRARRRPRPSISGLSRLSG